MIKDDELSNDKLDVNQQYITKSIYFESMSTETEKINVFRNTSPTIESNHSDCSFSENSLDFSSDENVSENNSVLLGLLFIVIIFCVFIYYILWHSVEYRYSIRHN